MITVCTVLYAEPSVNIVFWVCIVWLMNGWMDGILFGYFVCVSFRFVSIGLLCWEFPTIYFQSLLPKIDNRRWLLDKVGRQRRKWFRFFCFIFLVFFFSLSMKIVPFWRSITVTHIQAQTNWSILVIRFTTNCLYIKLLAWIHYIQSSWIGQSCLMDSFFAIEVPTQYWHLLHINNVVCTLYWLRFGKWKKGNRRTHNITYNDFKAAHNCLACTQARTNENQSPFNSKQCDAFQRPTDRPMRKQH